jgi:oligopeptide/dipeptide ABC transporter ATP-binding protein
MYQGRLVELASADQILGNPCHPYTRKLFSSVPGKQTDLAEDDDDDDARPVKSAGLKAARSLAGCPYADDCPIGDHECSEGEPVLAEIAEGHQVACFKRNGFNRS